MGIPASTTAWTLEDDTLLLDMISENLSYSAIGARLGRTKNACISRARRALGVGPRDRKLYVKLFAQEPPGAKQAAKAKSEPRHKQAAEPVERLFVAPATIPQDNEPQPLYAMPEASTTVFGEPRRLLKLEAHHCRFPAIERDGQHLFCSAPRDGLLPYCKDHALLCLRPEPKRNLSRLTKAYR